MNPGARASERKLVLITREVRLDALLKRFNTKGQAKYYVESRGQAFADYELEAETYAEAIRSVSTFLQTQGILQRVDRAFMPNFLFGPEDIVVCLGQDGLVANTLKYTSGQPVIGVNPDPPRFDGVLLPFQLQHLPTLLPAVLNGRAPHRDVTFGEMLLNDGRTFRAVNDFFIGPRSHTSARYSLQVGGKEERQSSSGIIVSTGMGSTAWLKSVVRGATGVSSALGLGKVKDEALPSLPWDADKLYFAVREPFPSRTTSTDLVFGEITAASPLVIASHMTETGIIFSDGIEDDFLEFNAGSVATIKPGVTKGKVICGTKLNY
jgi:hypothetical protein